VDFRDVYASLLRDWFLADEAEIQSLFEHQVVFHNLIGACNLGINENKGTKTTTLIYPNPTTESATLKLDSNAEKVHISIYDLNGRKVLEVFEGTLTPATHHIPLQIGDLKNGSYRVIVRKNDAEESLQLIKI
ncbi:MAG: T9SS C-terminal target domain-containing protein, partial [Crocinitomicaceae bacterium]|nr:T9SS C-terminal target domain-containing protein [Crocinitomicaceae bacterium]